jgi:hypothetical protein
MASDTDPANLIASLDPAFQPSRTIAIRSAPILSHNTSNAT